jgi:hypothetical protein
LVLQGKYSLCLTEYYLLHESKGDNDILFKNICLKEGIQILYG